MAAKHEVDCQQPKSPMSDDAIISEVFFNHQLQRRQVFCSYLSPCCVHTCHHVVQQKENATLCILTEISLDNTFTIPNETLMNYTSRSVLYPLPSET